MKYEFHVGDYVETKGGATGYISDVKELWWRCTNGVDGYNAGFNYSIIGIEEGFYRRIGQYDFTKPEQPKKIEYLGSGSLGNIFGKINELVDAVNELRDK